MKRNLSNLFTVTDLGACTHILGVKIERTVNGLFLPQKPFAQKIIDLAGMTNAKATDSPLPLSHPLYSEKKRPTDKEMTSMRDIPFREVLESLLFLAPRTSPDLTTAV